MKQPLKQQLRQHFKQIELSGQQLSDLEKMTTSKEEKSNKFSRLFGGNIAAVGIFLVASIAIFMMSQFSTGVSKDMPRLIAEEVVKNHLKLKPLEVKAENINSIRGYFSKLEFMPVDSRMVAQKGMQLIGGRYCSLQGITAAQLRLKQGKNLQTLYQTQYLPEIFGRLPEIEKGEAPLVVYAKGIKVKIWVEKGLLMALTDIPPENVEKEHSKVK